MNIVAYGGGTDSTAMIIECRFNQLEEWFFDEQNYAIKL